MPEYEHDNEMSIEFVILQHITQIGLISAHIYTSARSEWQVNALNYSTAIENLEALAQPYLSQQYAKRISVMDKKYHDKLDQYYAEKAQLSEAYLRKGQNYEMGLTLAYAILKFKYIQIELNKRGILRKRTTQAVDGGIPTDDSGSGTPE